MCISHCSQVPSAQQQVFTGKFRNGTVCIRHSSVLWLLFPGKMILSPLKAVEGGVDDPTAADPRDLPFPSPPAKSPAFPTTPLALSPHQGLGTKLVSQAGYAIHLNPYQAMQTGGRGKGKTKACHTALSLGCTPWTWKASSAPSVVHQNTGFSRAGFFSVQFCDLTADEYPGR